MIKKKNNFRNFTFLEYLCHTGKNSSRNIENIIWNKVTLHEQEPT